MIKVKIDGIEQCLRSIFDSSEKSTDTDLINAPEAERAFDFFEAARSEDSIKDLIKPMELEFNENLRRHCRSIWLQMEARLATIKGDSSMDAGTRRQLARELHGRLHEAQEWRTKCPRVYRGLGGKPGFMEEWVERLEEVRSELEVEVTKLRYQVRQDLLVKTLEIAHALSALDRYLSEGHRFQTLFSEGMAEVCAKNESRIQAAKEVIELHRWTAKSGEMLAELFADPNLATESAKISGELSDEVTGLIEGCIRHLKGCPPFALDSVSAIHCAQQTVNLYSDLQCVKKSVLRFCNEKTQGSLHTCIAKVRDLLRDRLTQFMNGIEGFLTSEEESVDPLRHTELNLCIIRRVRDILVAEDAELYPRVLSEQLECIEFDFKAQVSARVARYKDLPVAQYLQLPPRDVFRLFEMLPPRDGPSSDIPTALQLRGDMQQIKAALEASVRKAVRD